jgi:hypothetical protein
VDLVTLVTACALGADPKLMQALIWQQSGGNPWAVSVQSEPTPRIYTSLQDAVSATRELRDRSGTARVGLAGLPVTAAKVTPAVFAPCWNVAIAAQQITNLVGRCAARPQNTPIVCAIAAYRGSWEKPDIKFAAAVAKSLVMKNAPNFDMPIGTSADMLEIASGTLSRSLDLPSGSAAASEVSERGWSSALFPSSLQDSASKSMANPSASKATPEDQPSRASNVRVPAPKPATNGPFVGGLSDRRPQ